MTKPKEREREREVCKTLAVNEGKDERDRTGRSNDDNDGMIGRKEKKVALVFFVLSLDGSLDFLACFGHA